ncbi:hypothetical protein FSP39_017009 [Pinctada imbricata]|uniref:Uncharacterized protein n=1 Tax=Pinctada imbricata TaxID=66713 RepID=A0AA88YTN2_PINIB|nr:hypothetical protein FSP39_017009 [Pinctada imbricata]
MGGGFLWKQRGKVLYIEKLPPGGKLLYYRKPSGGEDLYGEALLYDTGTLRRKIAMSGYDTDYTETGEGKKRRPSFYNMSISRVWVSILWTFAAAIFIIVAPLVYEIMDVHGAIKSMRSIAPMSWTADRNGLGNQNNIQRSYENARNSNTKKSVHTSLVTIEDKLSNSCEEKNPSSLVDGFADPNHVKAETNA